MRHDRDVCADLDPGGQYARPSVPWEIGEHVPSKETLNVTIVRKLTEEFRLRRYVAIPGLNLTRPYMLEIEQEACLLCGAPGVCVGMWMADAIGPRYFETGESHDSREYALCRTCFDLPDKVEMIEEKLGVKS